MFPLRAIHQSYECSCILLHSQTLKIDQASLCNYMFVHMELSAPTGWIFMKFFIRIFFEKLCRKFECHYNMTRIKGTLYEDFCTFIILSRRILLRMRTFRTKFVKKIKTHISCSITFSRKSYRLWDNVENYGTVKQATDDNAMCRKRI